MHILQFFAFSAYKLSFNLVLYKCNELCLDLFVWELNNLRQNMANLASHANRNNQPATGQRFLTLRIGLRAV